MKWVLVHHKEMKMNSEEIQDLVQAALDQNYNKANEVFSDLMGAKVSDVLDQQKIAMADQIFNGIEPEDDDYQASEDDVDQQDDADLDISDEELDEILADDEEVEN